MKTALVCLLLAVCGCSLIVGITLEHQRDSARAELIVSQDEVQIWRESFDRMTDVALRQQNSINACVGELETVQGCCADLRKCQGVE